MYYAFSKKFLSYHSHVVAVGMSSISIELFAGHYFTHVACSSQASTVNTTATVQPVAVMEIKEVSILYECVKCYFHDMELT